MKDNKNDVAHGLLYFFVSMEMTRMMTCFDCVIWLPHVHGANLFDILQILYSTGTLPRCTHRHADVCALARAHTHT